ncbi:hypothetical protein [Rhodococcus qingshengii]|uniref:hypothetical protein n=1 Tax=Rhodococcus qingshengii TaxID=334542 RepID=UPI0035D9CF8A
MKDPLNVGTVFTLFPGFLTVELSAVMTISERNTPSPEKQYTARENSETTETTHSWNTSQENRMGYMSPVDDLKNAEKAIRAVMAAKYDQPEGMSTGCYLRVPEDRVFAELLADVFAEHARMGDLAVMFLDRTGGPETVRLARYILTGNK